MSDTLQHAVRTVDGVMAHTRTDASPMWALIAPEVIQRWPIGHVATWAEAGLIRTATPADIEAFERARAEVIDV